jgi:gamma-glutamylcyclotransferase (GGCT)/AIG2-like uncharacterized protein YtfP
VERQNFFFYGTLMDPAVLARVVGMNVTAARLRPAILEGYRRVCVSGQHYPSLVAAPGRQVAGRLFRGAGPEVQRRIAWYEDRDYDLRGVEVTGPAGIRSRALVYVAGPAMRLSDEDWEFEAWHRLHRRAFLTRLDLWMKGYVRRDAADAQRRSATS